MLVNEVQYFLWGHTQINRIYINEYGVRTDVTNRVYSCDKGGGRHKNVISLTYTRDSQ